MADYRLLKRQQKMEFRGGDIYIDDVLVWRNPDRSGIVRGGNVRHIDNKLWVNGELVYVAPGEKPAVESTNQPSRVGMTNRPATGVESNPNPCMRILLGCVIFYLVWWIRF